MPVDFAVSAAVLATALTASAVCASAANVNAAKKAALMNNVKLLLRGKDAVDENGKQITEFNNSVSQTYEMLAEIAVYNYE